MIRRFVRLAAATVVLATLAPTRDAEGQLSLSAGAAFPESPFGIGWHVGGFVQFPRIPWLRTDVTYSSFDQPDSEGQLKVLGISESVHLEFRKEASVRPYLTAGIGYYKLDYQGSVPSPSEFSYMGGGGLLFGDRYFVEARGLSMGDLHMWPIVFGIRLR